MNLNEFKLTGGARHGIMNASWPFATLKVTKDKLDLNISLLGNLHFRPADVISIVPYSYGPFSNGIRINHTVDAYKTTVVFKSFTDTNEVLRMIAQTGFLNNKTPLAQYEDMEIIASQSKGGFAIKTSAAIIIVAIWNVLLLPGFFAILKNGGHGFGIGPQLASGFMLLLCVTLIVSDPFRNLVLKEGRTFDDIKSFAYFMIFISGLMLIFSSIVSRAIL